jgi:hypothetical protein
MTITTRRESATTSDNVQVLFEEARQRRRRRYVRSGVALALVGSLGITLGYALRSTPKQPAKPHLRVAPPHSAPRFSVPAGVPRQPGPLALGPNGELYVADDARDEILARLPNGKFKVVAGTGAAGYSGDDGPATRAELNDPLGMAVASNGTLYFADAGNSRVRAILPNGTIITVAGDGLQATGPAGTPIVSGTPTDTAIGPTYDVALGADGSLYITTSFAVLELSQDNTLSDIVDPENDAGFAATEPLNNQCDPASVAVDGSGDLYFMCQDPYVLVERLPSGVLQPLGTDRPHDAAAALVEAPGGDVLAIDGFGVEQYGPAGQKLIANLLSNGLPNGEDFEPQGIAVSSNGTLYLSQDGISGIGPPTIVKQSPDGTVTVLWSPPVGHRQVPGKHDPHARSVSARG